MSAKVTYLISASLLLTRWGGLPLQSLNPLLDLVSQVAGFDDLIIKQLQVLLATVAHCVQRAVVHLGHPRDIATEFLNHPLNIGNLHKSFRKVVSCLELVICLGIEVVLHASVYGVQFVCTILGRRFCGASLGLSGCPLVHDSS